MKSAVDSRPPNLHGSKDWIEYYLLILLDPFKVYLRKSAIRLNLPASQYRQNHTASNGRHAIFAGDFPR